MSSKKDRRFDVPPKLTMHEQRVLQALWDGQSISESARTLDCSYGQVESDRHKLKGTFGVSNVVQLIRTALRFGMVKV
jgi:DNA-binding NarL/FixJ family response regulator